MKMLIHILGMLAVLSGLTPAHAQSSTGAPQSGLEGTVPIPPPAPKELPKFSDVQVRPDGTVDIGESLRRENENSFSDKQRFCTQGDLVCEGKPFGNATNTPKQQN